MPTIEADAVLSYGMLEGNAIVRANRVVYDPQSPGSPRAFRSNGSETKELAIVANEGEALRLSGTSELVAAGEKLRKEEKADVVIIKRGLHGALIFTEGKVISIPAYRTRSSFLIGSGDIFTSEFAYRWLIEGNSPEVSATFASLAVAYYSQSPTLPLPETLPESFTPTPINLDEASRRSVYLAGPFFNLQQLWMIDETLSQLTAQGLRVFSPLHDVGYGDPTLVAKEDIEGIVSCDSLFALVDGYDPGTLFEIGYARAKDKPVTAYLTSKESTHLTMLLGSGCDVFHDFVSAVCWEASR